MRGPRIQLVAILLLGLLQLTGCTRSAAPTSVTISLTNCVASPDTTTVSASVLGPTPQVTFQSVDFDYSLSFPQTNPLVSPPPLSISAGKSVTYSLTTWSRICGTGAGIAHKDGYCEYPYTVSSGSCTRDPVVHITK